MSKLGISFLDFWSNFDPTKDVLFGNWLRENSDKVYLGGNDIIIFSVFGDLHKKLTSKTRVKVLHTPENFISHGYKPFGDRPISLDEATKVIDSICDFSMLAIDAGSNNIRIPNYIRKYGYESVSIVEDRRLSFNKTKNIFSCYRIHYKHRDTLIKNIMNLIKVDSPCNCLRNMTDHVEDKLKYMEPYKITLAFENSFGPGYSSEKLYDCFLTKSIPVYWGDPNVLDDYNKESLIDVRDFETTYDLVNEMQKILSDFEYFNYKVSINPIKNKQLFDKSNFTAFMDRILKEAYGKSIR